MITVTDRRGRNRSISRKITVDAVLEAAERRMHSLDNPGFCVDCGNEQGGCEPDARGIRCEACGFHTVFGVEELVMAFALWGNT